MNPKYNNLMLATVVTIIGICLLIFSPNRNDKMHEQIASNTSATIGDTPQQMAKDIVAALKDRGFLFQKWEEPGVYGKIKTQKGLCSVRVINSYTDEPQLVVYANGIIYEDLGISGTLGYCRKMQEDTIENSNEQRKYFLIHQDEFQAEYTLILKDITLAISP